MFWLLASVETKTNKKSVSRLFIHDISSKDIIEEAQKIFSLAIQRKISINQLVLTSFLAIHTNHLQQHQAEEIFYKTFSDYLTKPKAISYQHMFEMYDTFHCYKGMKRLLKHAREKKIILPKRAWRALIRTCAWYAKITFNLLNLL